MPQSFEFNPSAPFANNYWNQSQNSGVIPSPATQTNPGSTIGAGSAQVPPSATAPPIAPTSWGPLSRGTPDTPQPTSSGNGADTSSSNDGSSGFVPSASAGAGGGLAGPGANTPTGSGGTMGGFGSFDDGGTVDDNNSTPSIDDALSTIQDTLAYGRKKNGLSGNQPQSPDDQQGVLPGGFAANTEQMRPSQNVEDMRPQTQVGQSDGAQPKMSASMTPSGPIPQQTPLPYPYGPKVGAAGAPGAFGRTTGAAEIMGDPTQSDPANSFADGGDVDNPSEDGMPARPQTNQPTPQPGQVQAQQNPRSLVGYAMGSDAVTPDIAQAMEAKVDPQGQMDGSTRKMLAIASAPDQQSQWGMMQHYRQKFNAYSAFARAAIQGNQQKPADPNAAAQAATAAFENVPDGTQTTVQPHQGGFMVHVKHLTGGKSVQSNASGGVIGFDDGGDVDEQANADTGGIPSYDSSQDQDTSTPGAGKNDLAASGTAKGDTTGQTQQDTSVPMTAQQFNDLLAQMPYDKIMDHGAAQTVQQIIDAGGQVGGMTPQGVPILKTKQPLDVTQTPTSAPPAPAIDPEILRQADALNLQGDQRTKFLMDQLGGNRTQKNALELQELKNKGLKEEWGVRGDTSRANNQNTVAGRLAVAVTNNQGAELRAQQSDLIKTMDARIAADPSLANDSAKLLKIVAPVATQLGLNPRAVMTAYQQQLQQPQGQSQGQQPQQAPAPEQRMVGSTYMTPKGPAKWMGQGWQAVQ